MVKPVGFHLQKNRVQGCERYLFIFPNVFVIFISENLVNQKHSVKLYGKKSSNSRQKLNSGDLAARQQVCLGYTCILYTFEHNKLESLLNRQKGF